MAVSAFRRLMRDRGQSKVQSEQVSNNDETANAEAHGIFDELSIQSAPLSIGHIVRKACVIFPSDDGFSFLLVKQQQQQSSLCQCGL